MIGRGGRMGPIELFPHYTVDDVVLPVEVGVA